MRTRLLRPLWLAGAVIVPLSLTNLAWAGMMEGAPPWEHCALCHGLDGVSRMPKFPKLAGQNYDYLAKQLRDFKAEIRTNDGGPMNGITHQFALPQLLEAARWFSEKSPPAPARMDTAAAAAGKALFRSGRPGVPACRTCHAPGENTKLKAPRLEAQHARYLAKQLHDFKTGERANDPGGVMRGIATVLTDGEIDSVASYLAATPRTEAKP